MDHPTVQKLKPLALDVLRYWEPRRILYNLLLLWATLRDLRADGAMDQLRDPRVLLTLVGLALAANLLYCAAHLVDFGLQLTRLRAPWLKVRWLLLLAGCWLALFIEHQQTGLISGLFRMI